MYYCYETLQKYYDANKALGSWNAREVYACPKKELYKKPFDYYYIVYDDERMGKFPLVRANRMCGLVTENGGVEECHPTEEYLYPTPPMRKKSYEEEQMEFSTDTQVDYPSMEKNNPTMVNTNPSSLVDEMLEKARNITIEDLVGEFCYE